jgi:hypothetical protein
MTPDQLVNAVLGGESPDHTVLDTLSEYDWNATIEHLLAHPTGRRWLRVAPQLDREWLDREGVETDVRIQLLRYEEDFRTKRRDASLNILLDCIPDDDLLQHACAIASSPAASAFWGRWDDPDELTRISTDILKRCDSDAAEATIYRFVVDPLDPYHLGTERRARIAAAALAASDGEVRGLAAEFLHEAVPEELLADFDRLVHDDSERVRGIVWSAALRLARTDARELAFTLIGDESASLDIRRSALVAAGTYLQTSELVDLLTWLVVHPDETLAADAAALLRDRHRHPDVALAAEISPHQSVREVAAVLLDPLSGSPAAGGSRTTSNTADIYRDALRQFEQRAADREPDPS